MLEFDEAAVDHDERPLITMCFRAASLLEVCEEDALPLVESVLAGDGSAGTLDLCQARGAGDAPTSGLLPLHHALPPSGAWSEVVFQDDRESLSRLQVDMFRTVQELLQFDEAAVDYDGRPLMTKRCRAASLREPVSSTTARR